MIKRILVAVAFATLSGASFAQGFGGGGQRGMMRMFQGGPFAAAMLLRRDDVQAELKLDDTQKGKLNAVQAGSRQRFQGAFTGFQPGGDQEEMQKQMQAKMQLVMTDILKDTMAVLTEPQQKRLKELGIQAEGSRAVLQDAVSKEIVLTDAQKAKLDELQRLQEEANAGLFEKLGSGELDRESLGAAMVKNTKIMDESILKLLTDKQKAKLKELGGETFTFKDPKPGTPGAFGRPGGG